ncbi:Na+/H+ antiporter subunit E [Paenibacillus crassostreae]|uniref:Cation:proton antiporter n=1 Tax=Paenibacillus crassostreae TaxID=1763538 RepID=A0A167ADA5_9BACL|nr:Na+/H+ antiporter subunit E [Paenibacillus crassostreae]AOZ92413.1 Na+/H+ antiporter subunit E [Paenibacillus crassostreae]OAB70874.1 cation:proton antiporter [Paenibacillus crassostreae]
MAFQILTNLMISFLWMFLHNDWSVSRFIIGFLMGIVILLVLRRFFRGPFYPQRVWAILALLVLFNRELVLSSIAVIRHILRPKLKITPGIFAYTTELKSDWEVTILSCLICLTPGTLTLEVSKDGQTLYIHAMDMEDANIISEQIRGTFEKAIMEVTRS